MAGERPRRRDESRDHRDRLHGVSSGIRLSIRSQRRYRTFVRYIAAAASNDGGRDQFSRIIQAHWKLIQEVHSSISLPFFTTLAFWLFVIFLSFGLVAAQCAGAHYDHAGRDIDCLGRLCDRRRSGHPLSRDDRRLEPAAARCARDDVAVSLQTTCGGRERELESPLAYRSSATGHRTGARSRRTILQCSTTTHVAPPPTRSEKRTPWAAAVHRARPLRNACYGLPMFVINYGVLKCVKNWPMWWSPSCRWRPSR